MRGNSKRPTVSSLQNIIQQRPGGLKLIRSLRRNAIPFSGIAGEIIEGAFTRDRLYK
jgi:hypothetical protein